MSANIWLSACSAHLTGQSRSVFDEFVGHGMRKPLVRGSVTGQRKRDDILGVATGSLESVVFLDGGRN